MKGLRRWELKKKKKKALHLVDKEIHDLQESDSGGH